jgi:hypothetical protein
MPVIEGAGLRTLRMSGVPGAGTNEVQTLTIGGTPSGGTFKLGFEGRQTGDIAWSATNATLLANMQAALDAAFGTNSVVASAGTIVAGIGTVLLTFGGAYERRAVPMISIVQNALTGAAPTLAIAETTPGVDAAFRGAQKGQPVVNEATGIVYVNTGTATAPVWTVAGAQT